ncbi:MAG: STAS domain-containing protein [Candidatus Baltobacteraceae bacterium]|jgi:anti-anti-sigma factor
MDQFSPMETNAASTAAFEAGVSEPRPLRELARFKLERRGTVCILHVSGDVDLSNSAALEAAITRAARAHRGALLVSFADCDFVDCSCLSVLIRQFRMLPVRLSIVAPPASRLRRLLDVTCLAGALPVHDGLREAQLAIGSSEGQRARLDEMTFMLRSSPRFRTEGPRKVSLLPTFRNVEGEPLPAPGRREPAGPQ